MIYWNFITQISDSKIRHLVGFLPFITFVLIFGYDNYFKIFGLSILLIISAFFEFNWVIFNKNVEKTIKIMEEYNLIEEKRKLSEKKQWNFFKNKFDFINIINFFFTMFFASLLFSLGMITTFSYFILTIKEELGILAAIYLFTFTYTLSLIIYNKNYGRKN